MRSVKRLWPTRTRDLALRDLATSDISRLFREVSMKAGLPLESTQNHLGSKAEMLPPASASKI